MSPNAPRIDLIRTDAGHRWRLWKGSRIIAASSETYTERRGAIENLETVLGGTFVVTSTPDRPKPYGHLGRATLQGADSYGDGGHGARIKL